MYTKIHNITIQIDSFIMQYCGEASLDMQLSLAEDMELLDTALQNLYDQPINRVSIYTDAECTNLLWNTNRSFVISSLVERILETGEEQKQMILGAC